MLGGKKKQNKRKETMQAKMIGKIPLRNDKKVLKIESRAEKESPSRDKRKNRSEHLRYW